MSKSPGKKDQSGKGAKAQTSGTTASAASKTVATIFGEMVWLLSRSPKYRDMKLSDLEWFVMPPLLLRQFKLSYVGQQPVALELFAKASPEVAVRIDKGEKKLLPAEWKSGEIHKLVEKVDLVAEAASVFPLGGSGPRH